MFVFCIFGVTLWKHGGLLLCICLISVLGFCEYESYKTNQVGVLGASRSNYMSTQCSSKSYAREVCDEVHELTIGGAACMSGGLIHAVRKD